MRFGLIIQLHTKIKTSKWDQKYLCSTTPLFQEFISQITTEDQIDTNQSKNVTTKDICIIIRILLYFISDFTDKHQIYYV